MAKKDRYGRRKGRESLVRRKPDLGYYFIATDAKATEKNYLTGLKLSLQQNVQDRIAIKVTETSTDNLVEKCKEQAAMQPQYAEPWIVFDKDMVNDFDEIIQKAESSGIKVGWSNPCIEIWFDAYFGNMHGYSNSKQCNYRFAETYERITGKEYNKAEEKIYNILNYYGDEEKAILIAEKRLANHKSGGRTKPSEMCPGTTLHELVREIRSKGSQ